MSKLEKQQRSIHQSHPEMKKFFHDKKANGTWYKGPTAPPGPLMLIGAPDDHCECYARRNDENESLSAYKKHALIVKYTESVDGMCHYPFQEMGAVTSFFSQLLITS